MNWALLGLGFFLMLFGVLSQAYSLKTKRGVLPEKSRFGRVMVRMGFFLAGLLLVALAAGRIVLHPSVGPR